TLRKSQWKVGIKDLSVLRHKVVLLGVGWWQYQEKPVSTYSKMMYRSLFSKRYLHAVRDNYTAQKLAEIGIKNVINTGCPTVWGLDEPHCSQINPKKARYRHHHHHRLHARYRSRPPDVRNPEKALP